MTGLVGKKSRDKDKKDENQGRRQWREQSAEEWSKKLLERYEDLRNVILKNMPKLWPGLEFALSVKTILNIKGCTLPFAGIILGPSSSLKTVIIELFRGYSNTFYTDNFSARSFVSHNTGFSEEKLKKIDMLPRIKNKFFLTPELAPIFSAEEKDLVQNLGIITRILDGHGYENDTGAQGHRGYSENIMFSWLGAAVDIPWRVHKQLSVLGPKLYFFRISKSEETEDSYYKRKDDVFEDKKQAIRMALLEYLAYFETNPNIEFESESGSGSDIPDLPKIPINHKNEDEELAHRYIIRLATLLSHLRAIVPTWETRETQGTEYAYTFANTEDSRAMEVLRNLARGHALSQSRENIKVDDIPMVIQVVISTASIERVRVFDLLIAKRGTLTTSQITLFLDVSKPTALRTMTELRATGLVDMTDVDAPEQHEITLKEKFSWFLTEEFDSLRSCKEKSPPRTPMLPLMHYDKSLNENQSVNGNFDCNSNSLRGGENSLHENVEPLLDNPTEGTITPITSIEEFFDGRDNEERWQPLPFHSLQQSPCYPIIGTRRYNGRICYYCKLHPDIKNVSLESIEHHCKYHEPELHKSKILGIEIDLQCSSNNLGLQRNEVFSHETIDGYSHLVDLIHCHPFVKWAGGKSQILSELDSMVPSQFNRYFEPFLGGGAMFFHLVSNRNRFTAYLSDINRELITAYKVVKDNVKELIQHLEKHQREYNKNPSEYYYKLRDQLKPTNEVDMAAKFIALNKTCYNGLYRVNRNGIFNVPIGRYKNPVICNATNLENVSNALRYSKAVIQISDYKEVLLNAKKDDFIYLDPPYHPVSSTANFTSYTNYGFGNNDQLALAKIFVALNDRGCKVLLSNSDTPFIRRLYSDFSDYIKEVKVFRSINSKTSRRIGHKELLIPNYSDCGCNG